MNEKLRLGDLPPGSELDRAVAESVMRWEFIQDYSSGHWWHGPGSRRDLPWCPSMDWRAMGEVVERLRELKWVIEIYAGPNPGVTLRGLTPETREIERTQGRRGLLDGVSRFMQGEETIPHAVCIAALRAVGVNVEQPCSH